MISRRHIRIELLMNKTHRVTCICFETVAHLAPIRLPPFCLKIAIIIINIIKNFLFMILVSS